MSTITLRAAMDIIKSGKAFDIEFVTADVERGRAGELKAYAQVTTTAAERIYSGRKSAGQKVLHKRANPHHEANSTVNIYVPGEDASLRIRKVHIRLITKINGLEVL